MPAPALPADEELETKVLHFLADLFRCLSMRYSSKEGVPRYTVPFHMLCVMRILSVFLPRRRVIPCSDFGIGIAAGRPAITMEKSKAMQHPIMGANSGTPAAPGRILTPELHRSRLVNA